MLIQVGIPDDLVDNDLEGKPEGLPSKLAKRGSKMAAKFSKIAIRMALATGQIDYDIVEIVDMVADAVENQADAGRDATFKERLKTFTGDSIGIVSTAVDNPYVSVRSYTNLS